MRKTTEKERQNKITSAEKERLTFPVYGATLLI